MAETKPTEAHYGLLVDVDRGLVFDRVMNGTGETPFLTLAEGEGEPVRVSTLVWDMEQLGWVQRPAEDVRWQLTDEGRRAREDSGL